MADPEMPTGGKKIEKPMGGWKIATV